MPCGLFYHKIPNQNITSKAYETRAKGVLATVQPPHKPDGGNSTETDYVGNMIFEEDNLKLMHTAEGRIAVSQEGGVNDYKYQYTLKDHLGNSRVTFGATEKEYLATMESELGNEEEAQFNGIAENREQNFMYNHTVGGAFTPDESLMLNSNKFANGERRITQMKEQIGHW